MKYIQHHIHPSIHPEQLAPTHTHGHVVVNHQQYRYDDKALLHSTMLAPRYTTRAAFLILFETTDATYRKILRSVGSIIVVIIIESTLHYPTFLGHIIIFHHHCFCPGGGKHCTTAYPSSTTSPGYDHHYKWS